MDKEKAWKEKMHLETPYFQHLLKQKRLKAKLKEKKIPTSASTALSSYDHRGTNTHN